MFSGIGCVQYTVHLTAPRDLVEIMAHVPFATPRDMLQFVFGIELHVSPCENRRAVSPLCDRCREVDHFSPCDHSVTVVPQVRMQYLFLCI